MKYKLSTLVVIVFFFASKGLSQTNFSGKWVINSQKSNFGIVPSLVIFEKTSIKQTMDSIFLNAGAPVSYPLNGMLIERVFQDTLNVAGNFAWTNDKKALIKTQTYSSLKKPKEALKKIKETWQLSPDRMELIIDRHFQSFNGSESSYTIKVVYDKEK